jgi:hypothetical protein
MVSFAGSQEVCAFAYSNVDTHPSRFALRELYTVKAVKIKIHKGGVKLERISDGIAKEVDVHMNSNVAAIIYYPAYRTSGPTYENTSQSMLRRRDDKNSILRTCADSIAGPKPPLYLPSSPHTKGFLSGLITPCLTITLGFVPS